MTVHKDGVALVLGVSYPIMPAGESGARHPAPPPLRLHRRRSYCQLAAGWQLAAAQFHLNRVGIFHLKAPAARRAGAVRLEKVTEGRTDAGGLSQGR
jgi:hypothetical protein